MSTALDLTIVIPTHNRAKSLAETLSCLERTDQAGIRFQIVVVENGIRDETENVVSQFSSRLPVSYLYEPKPGKSKALIRAINEAPLGEIVAVLDDDMSPESNWLQGVLAISRRWPNHGYFSGLSYIIWPDVPVPDWAKAGGINHWAFSVTGINMKEDMVVNRGDFVSGGQFWFRSSVLNDVPQFQDHLLTEYSFVFRLQQCGHEGITGIDAVTGHRLQTELLDSVALRNRAIDLGRQFAELKMTFADLTRPGNLYRRSRLKFWMACSGSLGYWCCLWLMANLNRTSAKRISKRLRATERIADRAGLIRYRKLAVSAIDNGGTQ